ncbi:MAG TPA: homoserine kinase [Alphaproteobacteria bacterium]|nr:homoserine kinase [Alphaproteobacteria bacterium]
MAVYTEVSDEELSAFLAAYDLGALRSYKGIAEGVENSNFLLQTERASYILTLYEKRVAPQDLPFFLGLMDHLAAKGIACPTPIHARDGQALRTLAGRPAALVSFLAGMSPRRILPHHCAGLGRGMAEMHVAAADFKLRRANSLSLNGWQRLYGETKTLANDVAPGLEGLIENEVAWLTANWPQADALPRGIIHADLFPDNAFFLGDKLSGIIDFYFACEDFLAYDLAVCLNAWCFEADGMFNISKARGLLSAYRDVRPITEAELAALPMLARGAALRFLLTRLYDWLNRPEGAWVKPKNPMEYVQKLRFHQSVPGPGAYGLD